MARPPRPSLKDDPFPKGRDWSKGAEWFRRRLEAKSEKEKRLFASRASLRSLPFLHHLLDIDELGEESSAKALLLPCLRCSLSSVGASVVPPDEIEKIIFLDVESAAHYSASVAFNAAETVASNSAAYIASSMASTSAARAVYAKSFFRYAPGNAAAYSAYAVDAAAYFGAAFEQDCRLLEAGGWEALLASPLWPSWENDIRDAFALLLPKGHDGSQVPAQFYEEWVTFSSRLERLPDDFFVWVEWFNALRHGARDGRYLFGLPTARALRLNVDFALIDDKLWKGDPAALHAEMRRLIEVARGEEAQLEIKGIFEGAEPAEPDGPQKKKSPKRSPKVESVLGQLVIENAKVLVAQSDLASRLIVLEIKRLKETPANHPDTQAEQERDIAHLEDTLKAIEATRTAIEGFEAGQKPESAVKKALKKFAQGIGAWLDGKAPKHIEHATQIGIVATSTAIFSLTKADPNLCLLISGAIVAKDPVVAVLSAWKNQSKTK